MHHLWQDLRYSLRSFLKHRSFFSVSILTIALGIGMNTAIFSIVNAVMLHPLPVPDENRLVIVSSTVRREALERRSVSYADFLDWRNDNAVFESLSVQAENTFTWNPEGGATRVDGEFVSGDYFRLLGARLFRGRTFHPEEDRAGSAVAVVSYEFWKNRAGSDPTFVGKIIRLDEKPVQVVGILSQGFFAIQDKTEIWLPVTTLSLFGSENLVKNRGNRWLNVIGKLKQRVTISQANSALNGIAVRLETEYPRTNLHYGVMLIPMRKELLGDVQSAAIILFCAVLFVLLIACVNIANLQMVRVLARRKELAIREALGASQLRMTQQLITESLFLTLTGGAISLFLAHALILLIVRFSPIELPRAVPIRIDFVVFLFALSASLLAGFAIGIVTVFRLKTSGSQQSLKDTASTISESRAGRRIRGGLVITETALAFMLLIGAGLMIRSFRELQNIPLGFQKENSLTMRLSFPSRYEGEKGNAFKRELLEKMEAIPSVSSACLSSDYPLEDNTSATVITVEGNEPPLTIRTYRHQVTKEFFQTLGIRLIRGDSFNGNERGTDPPTAVISRKMASRLWPNEDAIGKRIKLGRNDSERPWMTVIGVADEVKYRSLVDDPMENGDDPDLYLSMNQFDESNPALILRTLTKVTDAAALVRNMVQKMDRDIPVSEVRTLREVVSSQTAESRFSSFLMTIFGFVALVLACIGLYGVLNDVVQQQTHEIGIRMALGATRNGILLYVLRSSCLWISCGLLAGLLGASVVGRLLSSRLYNVTAIDPTVYALISGIMVVVAFAAAYLPARRATRIDPMLALRLE